MSTEAEMAIVASVLRSEAVYDSISATLGVGDFGHAASRLMYEKISEVRNAGMPVDRVVLANALDNSEDWLLAGYGRVEDYCKDMARRPVSPAHVKSYIGIIKSASATRSLHDYAFQLSMIAEDQTLTTEEKLAKSQALFPIVQGNEQDAFKSYYEAGKGAVKQVSDRMNGKVKGLLSGMSNVDEMTLGWEPGTLNILAGRPSHGKSALSMDWVHAASEQGAVFVFSLEMTAANLAMRAVSSLGDVDYGDLRGAKLDENMVNRMDGALNRMKNMPVYIDDRGGISVDQLRTRARIMARRDKPKMIVTDYLTLLSGVGENRTSQVGYVSRSLKAMAKELDCAVICLAQLNRGVDSRPDKRPTLSDLRDSGEIEQDADIVMFTYLHEKYDPDTPRKGIGELVFAKQRNGETGSVFLEWQGRYQRFKPFLGVVPPLEAEKDEVGNSRGPKPAYERRESYA